MNKVIVKRNRSWPDYDEIARLTKYDARRFEALLNAGLGSTAQKLTDEVVTFYIFAHQIRTRLHCC